MTDQPLATHGDDLNIGGDLPPEWWTCHRTDPTQWPRPVHTTGPCPDPA